MERIKAKEAHNLAKDKEAEDLRTKEESEALALSFQDQSLSPIEKTLSKQGTETVDITLQSECPSTSSQIDLQMRYNFQVALSQSFASDIGCDNLDKMLSPGALFNCIYLKFISFFILFLITAKIPLQIILQSLLQRFFQHPPLSLLKGYTVLVKILLPVSFH